MPLTPSLWASWPQPSRLFGGLNGVSVSRAILSSACLINRTPCALAISPSSCGSMMTKRDLSYAKCRSISGKVPLPIEPKPIMTMGPEIFAWICAAGGLIKFVSGKGKCVWRERSGSTLGGDFDFDLHLGLQKRGDDKDG